MRANVELARLRTHQARWRTALVDSLQEAFFVCDADGAVIEINAAFTDILGYSTDGLPYHPVHPWWPSAETDPEGYRAVDEAFATLLGRTHGTYTIPVTHRDGHRLWARAAFAQAQDPDTGRAVIVGTFRDVTAEHYAIQRDSALASMSTRLAEATTLTDAMAGALSELKDLWRAEGVVASVFGAGDEPTRTYADPPVTWENLPEDQRRALGELRQGSLLAPVSGHTWSGTVLEHPHGQAGAADRPGRPPPVHRRGPAAAVAAGSTTSGRAWAARTRSTSNARPPSPCSGPSSAPPTCPPGSPSATNPRRGRWRSAATGTTRSRWPTGASGSSSATASAAGCTRPP